MNRRVIGANLVVSLKTFSREKSVMFFTVAFPIILVLVFGTIFLNQDDMTFDLSVQDLDRTKASAQPSPTPGTGHSGFGASTVPLPPFWGGYRVAPDEVHRIMRANCAELVGLPFQRSVLLVEDAELDIHEAD